MKLSNQKNNTKARASSRRRKRPEVPLKIRLCETPAYYDILLHSVYLKKMIIRKKIIKDEELVHLTDTILKRALSATFPVSALFEKCRYLTVKFFGHGIDKLLKKHTLILIRNETNLLPALFCNKDRFWQDTKAIIYHNKLQTLTPSRNPGHKRGKLRTSVILPEKKRDNDMLEEADGIINILSGRKDTSFEVLNKNVTRADAAYALEQSRLIHFIGHGEKRPDAAIILDNDAIDINLLKKLSSVPEVFIISSCAPFLDDTFTDLFFKKGGQILIFTRTDVNSSDMKMFFYAFYQNLFKQELPVCKIFHNTMLETIKESPVRRALEIHGSYSYKLKIKSKETA